MPIISNNTPTSLFAGNSLSRSNNDLQTASERLSSGLRINRAKDDAAGLAIATRLASQLLGSQTAYRNTNDGISLAQTADGAISEVSNITQRIRELAVQSANGTLSDQDRASLQAEASSLQEEASRIFSTTEFNGTNLLNNNASIDIQTGSEAGDSISINTTDLAGQLTTDGFFAVDISTAGGAQTALSSLNSALDTLSQSRAAFGATSNRLESASRSLQERSVNIAAAKSRIQDASIAEESANRTRALIQQNAGLAVSAQANLSSDIVSTLLK